jgi:type II secretory pathway pseudopilin PulG
MRPQNDTNQDGFILLEVVIALFIMGLTFQGGLLLMTHMNQQRKRMETETKQDMLLRTLAAHALIHGRLPWAANKDAPPASLGYEDKAALRQSGILPFKTLGLAEHYAKDGYGHYFTYLVAKTRPALLTVSPLENYCRAQAEIPLIHKDYPIDPRDDFIGMALMSDSSKTQDQDPYAFPHLPEPTPNLTVTWVTRNTLLTLYGQSSCAPFHQPLPERPALDAPGIPRGYGR